jgi:hypothetical protein
VPPWTSSRSPRPLFRVLFVIVILSHDRRRIVLLNVTDHPTAAWTRQQIREAFPGQTAPRYLVRDRDGSYVPDFGRLLQSFGTEDILTAPRAPWQNPFVQRLIGTLRRACLDHVIVWNQRSLRRTVNSSWITITSGARTSRWTRMRRSREPHNGQPVARLFKSPRRRPPPPLRTARREDFDSRPSKASPGTNGVFRRDRGVALGASTIYNCQCISC